MTREVHAPKGRYTGRHKIYCSVYRDWNTLCQNRPGPMRRCYIELADNPFPPMQTNRHHQLKGKLKGFWEYEVDGGARVRYKRPRRSHRRPRGLCRPRPTRHPLTAVHTGHSPLTLASHEDRSSGAANAPASSASGHLRMLSRRTWKSSVAAVTYGRWTLSLRPGSGRAVGLRRPARYRAVCACPGRRCRWEALGTAVSPPTD